MSRKNVAEYMVKIVNIDWFDDPNLELPKQWEAHVVATSPEQARWKGICETESDVSEDVGRPCYIWNCEAIVD